VIDVAGPIPFVLEGARLAALAAGQPLPLPHEDPDLAHAITTALATLPAITAFRLAPGSQARASDLSVILTLAPMETCAAQIPPDADSCGTNPDVELAAARISAAIEGRVRAAEISVEPGTP
jgi:hypothetical protein